MCFTSGQVKTYADGMARRRPTARDEVRITDPRAIRALAHPARLEIIHALYGGELLTATECARLTGLSPSATSYHMRALERWGIIERAPAAADGRERPWRAAGRTLHVDSRGSEAATLADSLAVRTLLDRDADALSAFVAGRRHEPAAWRRTSTLTSAQAWMTPDEVAEMGAAVQAALDRYRDRGSSAERPSGARPVRVSLLTVPLPGPRPRAESS